MPSVFALALLAAIGCDTATTATTGSRSKPALSIEERAVRDALDRFVHYTRASELTIEPNEYLSKPPAKVGAAVIAVMTREQLADRHRGDQAAPLTTTIHLYRPTREPAPNFCVSIHRGSAASTGFEATPYGMMITYCYVLRGELPEMVSDSVEVE